MMPTSLAYRAMTSGYFPSTVPIPSEVSSTAIDLHSHKVRFEGLECPLDVYSASTDSFGRSAVYSRALKIGLTKRRK